MVVVMKRLRELAAASSWSEDDAEFARDHLALLLTAVRSLKRIEASWDHDAGCSAFRRDDPGCDCGLYDAIDACDALYGEEDQ